MRELRPELPSRQRLLPLADKKLVLDHVKPVTPSADYKYDNDFGNEWLKTGYAGSGAFKLREWRANEVVVLERNDNYYGEKAKLARVIYRFMKESLAQRLALEAGDIDIARNLSRATSKPSPRTPISPTKARRRHRLLHQPQLQEREPEEAGSPEASSTRSTTMRSARR